MRTALKIKMEIHILKNIFFINFNFKFRLKSIKIGHFIIYICPYSQLLSFFNFICHFRSAT